MLETILLGECIREIFDDNISLRIKLLVLTLLVVKSYRFAANLSIVHLVEASFSFFLSVESEETVLKRFLSFVITLDHGFLELVSTRTKCFEQFKVVEVGRQISSV